MSAARLPLPGSAPAKLLAEIERKKPKPVFGHNRLKMFPGGFLNTISVQRAGGPCLAPKLPLDEATCWSSSERARDVLR